MVSFGASGSLSIGGSASISVDASASISGGVGAPLRRQDPYMAFNFLVEINGLWVGGFRDVKGLESHVEVKEYAEGGLNGYIHKIPGETRYPNLVLSRGLTDIDSMWSWYDSVSRGVITRRNVTLMLLDAQRIPVMWWDIRDALPVKWTGPNFDATRGTEVAIESIELVHRGITKPATGQVVSLVRGAAQLF